MKIHRYMIFRLIANAERPEAWTGHSTPSLHEAKAMAEEVRETYAEPTSLDRIAIIDRDTPSAFSHHGKTVEVLACR